jgi:hypothetical protein
VPSDRNRDPDRSFSPPDSAQRASCTARVAAAAITLLFLAQAIHGLWVKSGTCDELAAHVPAGILHWKSGECSGGLANPPLGQLLVGAGPVLLGTADHPLADSPRALLPARLPVLLLGLFTLFATSLLAARAAGPAAALAALGAAALSPNLVAHTRLATLDMPATAFTALACLLAWRAARRPDLGSLIAVAVAVGVACQLKYTALHLVPSLSLGALLLAGSWRARALRCGAILLAGLAGTIALAWLTALASPWPVEASSPAHGGVGARIASTILPTPYVEGVVAKWRHAQAGHFAYLLGKRSTEGFPHYFAVAIAVKTPLSILAAGAVGAWALARHRLSGDRAGFVAFALLPAAWLFVAMSLTQHVHIGLRHVLPIYPALLALAGIGWAQLWRTRGAARVVAGALALWAVVAAATITPDHLAYFNEVAGGPDHGDRILIDSNLDWGQDEGRFRAWAATREVAVNPPYPCRGLVAANVNALRGIFSADGGPLRWLTLLEPVHTIGHTWRIWRVDENALRAAAGEDPVKSLDFANWLAANDEPQEALTLLRRHDLSGDEQEAPRWHAVLTEALLASGATEDAARAVVRSRDPLLAAIVSHRLSEMRHVPWLERDPRERSRIFPALCRRGRLDEARELARRVLAAHPDDADARRGLAQVAALAEENDALLFTGEPSPVREQLTRAALLKEFGAERLALRRCGEVLAGDPANAKALWLYGELVVRRKLGLTEYELPEIDWSHIGRVGATRSAVPHRE